MTDLRLGWDAERLDDEVILRGLSTARGHRRELLAEALVLGEGASDDRLLHVLDGATGHLRSTLLKSLTARIGPLLQASLLECLGGRSPQAVTTALLCAPVSFTDGGEVGRLADEIERRFFAGPRQRTRQVLPCVVNLRTLAAGEEDLARVAALSSYDLWPQETRWLSKYTASPPLRPYAECVAGETDWEASAGIRRCSVADDDSFGLRPTREAARALTEAVKAVR